MKAIHNWRKRHQRKIKVVLYPKDTEKWKQFTTEAELHWRTKKLFCIPKILKNESNSQLKDKAKRERACCFVSQRYWKMKAIHNNNSNIRSFGNVVLYPKDTEKWKQFTTGNRLFGLCDKLFCIPKILKNESNSQQDFVDEDNGEGCFVSQRYWKMKAIHNKHKEKETDPHVVLYPKDTEKWKQFTTENI